MLFSLNTDNTSTSAPERFAYEIAIEVLSLPVLAGVQEASDTNRVKLSFSSFMPLAMIFKPYNSADFSEPIAA